MPRLKHHLILAVLVVAGIGAVALSGTEASLMDAVSISSAYLCLALLCAGLAIGPLHAIRTGRPYLNNYLRRDIGIWAALTGLLHFYAGNVVAMSAVYIEAFVDIVGPGPSGAMRRELFSWVTIAGTVVAVLLLLLLALSSDRSLRFVGTRWWKRLHRTSYVAFVLTAAHGLAFQVLESRMPALIVLVAAAGAGVIALQFAGIRAVRLAAQRSSGNTRSPSNRIDAAGS
jgi:sulfoxide reductase heme-binding subunit YedZ